MDAAARAMGEADGFPARCGDDVEAWAVAVVAAIDAATPTPPSEQQPVQDTQGDWNYEDALTGGEYKPASPTSLRDVIHAALDDIMLHAYEDAECERRMTAAVLAWHEQQKQADDESFVLTFNAKMAADAKAEWRRDAVERIKALPTRTHRPSKLTVEFVVRLDEALAAVWEQGDGDAE